MPQGLRVQVPPPAQDMSTRTYSRDKKLQAYVIGAALGDGNLSNPNGRAVRLRITCDKKYPKLADYIRSQIQKLMPENKVSVVNRTGCVDISCYSNHWEEVLGWRADGGSKFKQGAGIPQWVKDSPIYSRECLRGLFQTDGCLYKDRGYMMLSFTNTIRTLVDDVEKMLIAFGYHSSMRRILFRGKENFTLRVSKDVAALVEKLGVWKE